MVGIRVSSPVVSRRDIGLRSERGPILAAVMLSMSLVAIDTTILATAVPTVVADLGGFTQFPWLFSVYVLTAAVVTPLAGKLADIVGRKPVLIGGIVVFVLGSVLCGVAWSMTSLIVFRAIQGLGAGAVQPMAMTIVGDVYTMAERAKVQGYLASVWAGAAVVGPTLGGLFADYLNWRGIFLINVPLGVVAVILLRRLDSTHQRRASSVDWVGALFHAYGAEMRTFEGVDYPESFYRIGRRVAVVEMLKTIPGFGVKVRGKEVAVEAYDVDDRTLVTLVVFVVEPAT